MVIQTGTAPAVAPTSGGKKFLILLILLIFAGIGLVWANMNGYVTLPDSVTKFIPPQYLPASAEAPAEEPAAEAPAETYAEEPETYEEEMAKYETESYKDEPETYEEEKYADEGSPEAYQAW
jgi:hypothetical protein